MIRWGLRLDRGTQGCSSGDHWVQKLGARGCSRFQERAKDTCKVREGSVMALQGGAVVTCVPFASGRSHPTSILPTRQGGILQVDPMDVDRFRILVSPVPVHIQRG
jgi:hypothetical protein